VKYGKAKPSKASRATRPPAVPYPPDVPSRVAEEPAVRPRFSDREKLVGGWLAEGKSDPDIAGILQIGLETVRTYVKSMRLKTNSASRNELFAWIWRDRIACLGGGFAHAEPGKYS
jgi:DNA-binding CsgD family transcriptional regulator